jgi:hypothetical protein
MELREREREREKEKEREQKRERSVLGIVLRWVYGVYSRWW